MGVVGVLPRWSRCQGRSGRDHYFRDTRVLENAMSLGVREGVVCRDHYFRDPSEL